MGWPRRTQAVQVSDAEPADADDWTAGERALWAAVLARAVSDLRYLGRRRGGRGRGQLGVAARAWLFERGQEADLREVCARAGLDVVAVRRVARERMRAGGYLPTW